MTRAEYIEELRDYLISYSVDPYFINENIDYYGMYIDNEISSGKDPDEVFRDLGAPTVLGRSIVDKAAREGRVTKDPHTVKVQSGTYTADEDDFTEEEDESFAGDSVSGRQDYNAGRSGGLTPGKLKFYLILGLIFAILILVLVVGLIANLFRLFFPAIVVAVLVVGVILFFGGSRWQ